MEKDELLDPTTAAAAMGALSALGAWLSAGTNAKITAARNSVYAAQAKAENLVRDASNAFSFARSNVARQQQALANTRITENLGRNLEEQVRNYSRQKDMTARASFEDQIREAETAGEQAALAAFSGVGGDAVDVVSGTTALRAARAEEEVRRYSELADADYRYARTSMVNSAISGMDNTTIMDDIDYGISVARQDFAPRAGSAAFNAFMSNGGGEALMSWGAKSFDSLFKAKPQTGGSGFRAPGALAQDTSYRFNFLPKETFRRL